MYKLSKKYNLLIVNLFKLFYFIIPLPWVAWACLLACTWLLPLLQLYVLLFLLFPLPAVALHASTNTCYYCVVNICTGIVTKLQISTEIVCCKYMVFSLEAKNVRYFGQYSQLLPVISCFNISDFCETMSYVKNCRLCAM